MCSLPLDSYCVHLFFAFFNQNYSVSQKKSKPFSGETVSIFSSFWKRKDQKHTDWEKLGRKTWIRFNKSDPGLERRSGCPRHLKDPAALPLPWL